MLSYAEMQATSSTLCHLLATNDGAEPVSSPAKGVGATTGSRHGMENDKPFR
jgi:hypothetical protein